MGYVEMEALHDIPVFQQSVCQQIRSKIRSVSGGVRSLFCLCTTKVRLVPSKIGFLDPYFSPVFHQLSPFGFFDASSNSLCLWMGEIICFYLDRGKTWAGFAGTVRRLGKFNISKPIWQQESRSRFLTHLRPPLIEQDNTEVPMNNQGHTKCSETFVHQSLIQCRALRMMKTRCVCTGMFMNIRLCPPLLKLATKA